MTTSVMTSTIDGSLAALLGLLSLVIGIALYVWLALALAATFRKMGEDTWKGWVPFLNYATVLKWGGFSPWLILLALIPGLGVVAVFILRLMRTDLTLLAIDPNVTSIVEGTVMVAVVMLGAFLAMRERRP